MISICSITLAKSLWGGASRISRMATEISPLQSIQDTLYLAVRGLDGWMALGTPAQGGRGVGSWLFDLHNELEQQEGVCVQCVNFRFRAWCSGNVQGGDVNDGFVTCKIPIRLD